MVNHSAKCRLVQVASTAELYEIAISGAIQQELYLEETQCRIRDFSRFQFLLSHGMLSSRAIGFCLVCQHKCRELMKQGARFLMTFGSFLGLDTYYLLDCQAFICSESINIFKRVFTNFNYSYL
jgi:hypothetical protein